ncbi:MAG: flippase-like domain-containing protein [Desulfovibrionaceae bacterium]|nr:flippase-like domain-containing protein [Desulfovibrionaceae bacterium]MBF0514107.1 flippase-like domain-containing protein [Desulfovibrionaceae bacterium]
MKRYAFVIRLAFVAILLGAAAWAIDPARLWQSLTPAMALAVLPAVAVGLAGSIPLAMRLAVLAGGPSPSIVAAWKAFVLTASINSFLPGRVGELVKPVFLNEHARVPLGNGFAALFLERVIDVAILFGLALIAASMAFVHLDWKFAAGVFAGLLGLLGVIPLVEGQLLKLGRFIPLERARAFYADALAHTASTVREGRAVTAFLLGLAGWVMPIAGTYVFLRLALPVPIGFEGALSVFVVTTFSYLIPVLPAGMGAYEAGAVLALQFYGVPAAQGLALAIVWHAGNILTMLLCGGAVLIHDRIGLGAFLARLKSK